MGSDILAYLSYRGIGFILVICAPLYMLKDILLSYNGIMTKKLLCSFTKCSTGCNVLTLSRLKVTYVDTSQTRLTTSLRPVADQILHVIAIKSCINGA